mmetsp:Transcript_35725/g.142854  ORF Transcript_35725/g.142854 Transcript_35725/m.142854 type:complete len:86 (+) Transcript_35725:5047-5304(+)
MLISPVGSFCLCFLLLTSVVEADGKTKVITIGRWLPMIISTCERSTAGLLCLVIYLTRTKQKEMKERSCQQELGKLSSAARKHKC